MASLGVPITGDPLYPNIVDVDAGDFSSPLKLLAHTLEFEDPLSGVPHQFTSNRALT